MTTVPCSDRTTHLVPLHLIPSQPNGCEATQFAVAVTSQNAARRPVNPMTTFATRQRISPSNIKLNCSVIGRGDGELTRFTATWLTRKL